MFSYRFPLPISIAIVLTYKYSFSLHFLRSPYIPILRIGTLVRPTDISVVLGNIWISWAPQFINFLYSDGERQNRCHSVPNKINGLAIGRDTTYYLSATHHMSFFPKSDTTCDIKIFACFCYYNY